MKNPYIQLVQYLSKRPDIDAKTISDYLKRLKVDSRIAKKEGTEYHFCSFLVPIDFKKKKIYLGHHIKANDWVPPGGHIEPGEMPFDTVRREFEEELSFTLTDEKIELVNLSIKEINNDKRGCMRHYDFWCLVHIDEQPFQFDSGEFYDAGWIDFKEALKKTKTPQFKNVMEKIISR